MEAGDSPVAVPIVAVPDHPDRNPAAVYLAGKPSATGRRGLQRSLDRAAELLTGGLATNALVVILSHLIIEGEYQQASYSFVANVRWLISRRSIFGGPRSTCRRASSSLHETPCGFFRGMEPLLR